MTRRPSNEHALDSLRRMSWKLVVPVFVSLAIRRVVNLTNRNFHGPYSTDRHKVLLIRNGNLNLEVMWDKLFLFNFKPDPAWTKNNKDKRKCWLYCPSIFHRVSSLIVTLSQPLPSLIVDILITRRLLEYILVLLFLMLDKYTKTLQFNANGWWVESRRWMNKRTDRRRRWIKICYQRFLWSTRWTHWTAWTRARPNHGIQRCKS